MDNGLPGVSHVRDDTVGEDQQDEVLLPLTGDQVSTGTEGWGRQGQYQLCTGLASVHTDHGDSADRLLMSPVLTALKTGGDNEWSFDAGIIIVG